MSYELIYLYVANERAKKKKKTAVFQSLYGNRIKRNIFFSYVFIILM